MPVRVKKTRQNKNLDQRVMASHELTRRHGAQFRHLVAASLICAGTAGVKPAAGRRRERRWRLSHRHGLGGTTRSMTRVTPGDRERLFQRTRLCGTKRRHKITQFSRTMLN